MIVLVDHDLFPSILFEERASKTVLGTRGLGPEQPALELANHVLPLRSAA